MVDKWRPGYPACASTPEDDGPNFSPTTMFNAINPHNTRLREAAAFSKVSRETADFHERKARSYGVDHPIGLAHFKAAKAYRSQESAGRLQEMFENGGEVGELPPKAIMKANRAAMGFHKKQAEKAGLDSDEGHAHIAALEHHMDIFNKAKQQHAASHGGGESSAGISGKKSPVPVPKKSDMPNGDIRQNKPPVPVQQLQQSKKREAGGNRLSMGLDCTEPSSTGKQAGKNVIFKGKRLKPAKRGPLAAKPQIHGNDIYNREAKGKGGGQYVAQRYDKSHPEGFVSPEYSGMKNGINESSRRKVRPKLGKRSLESRRSDEVDTGDGPPMITLNAEKPARHDGWRGGSYSPPIRKIDNLENGGGIIIKEF